MKFLYHGSARKIIGDRLIPHEAEDLGKRVENMHKAVYATNNKEIAIAMAIISAKGVHYSSLTNNRPYGRIYKGVPEQDEVYLYYLNSKDFQQQRGNRLGQWISEKPVKPVKVEKIKIKDYLKLVRDATETEKQRWIKKYGKL
jgi:hypothetical protein